jgi:hypothetical protein
VPLVDVCLHSGARGGFARTDSRVAPKKPGGGGGGGGNREPEDTASPSLPILRQPAPRCGEMRVQRTATMTASSHSEKASLRMSGLSWLCLCACGLDGMCTQGVHKTGAPPPPSMSASCQQARQSLTDPAVEAHDACTRWHGSACESQGTPLAHAPSQPAAFPAPPRHTPRDDAPVDETVVGDEALEHCVLLRVMERAFGPVPATHRRVRGTQPYEATNATQHCSWTAQPRPMRRVHGPPVLGGTSPVVTPPYLFEPSTSPMLLIIHAYNNNDGPARWGTNEYNLWGAHTATRRSRPTPPRQVHEPEEGGGPVRGGRW